VEVACRIEGADWYSDQLRLRVDGPRFARANQVHASIVVPITNGPVAATAVMDDGHVLVRAVLARADVHLHAPKPAALLGIVTPVAHANLIWSRSSVGAIRIALDARTFLKSPDPFEADVPCIDLAIVGTSYNARESITKRNNLPKRDVTRDGAPIAATPGGATAAELRSGVQVELIEARGAQSRIIAEDGSYVLSGWVASKDLGPPLTAALGYGYGTGTGRLHATRRSDLMHCPSAVGLFVEQGSELVKVGAIHNDAGFQPKIDATAVESDLREIQLPESPWLTMDPSARLVALASELRECHQTF
jgi:hypothetical protein